MNLRNIKERTVVDYEIDPKKIEAFYGRKEKINIPYNVIQKKILFRKENTMNAVDKRKQYSHYLTFHYLVTRKYGKEDIKSEIGLCLDLLKYSKGIRNELVTTFNIDKLTMSNNSTSTDITPVANTNISLSIQRKWKMAINVARITENLLRKYRLLKLKNNEDMNGPPQTQIKLFCQLDKKSFVSSMFQPAKLNLKFYNQKEKILRGYNRESTFVYYIHKCNYNIIKASLENLDENIKEQFSKDIIHSIYHPREIPFYNKYDSFMEKYDITPLKVQNKERDLYEHLYAILSKSNYVNFLSFLYSKNDLFKFIYDEFSDKEADVDCIDVNDKLNQNFPQQIDAIESILQEDEQENEKKKKNKKTAIAKENPFIKNDYEPFEHIDKQWSIVPDLLDRLIGCDSCFPITFIPTQIDQYTYTKFHNKELENNNDFYNKLAKCITASSNYMLVIKDSQVRIFEAEIDLANTSKSQDNDYVVEAPLSSVSCIEIKKEEINDDFAPTTDMKINLLKDVNEDHYYLFKISAELNNKLRDMLKKRKVFGDSFSKDEKNEKETESNQSEKHLNMDDLRNNIFNNRRGNNEDDVSKDISNPDEDEGKQTKKDNDNNKTETEKSKEQDDDEEEGGLPGLNKLIEISKANQGNARNNKRLNNELLHLDDNSQRDDDNDSNNNSNDNDNNFSNTNEMKDIVKESLNAKYKDNDIFKQ